jgi:uncharacterized glyoxalase superfamily protein PhnB
MRRNRSIPNATVIPELVYPDVRQAADWLCKAFGFTQRLYIPDNHRFQLTVGDGALVVVDVRHSRIPPRQGEATHGMIVRVEDARAHCEHARAQGARITMEPTDFEYGERQYHAADPWGHQWTFSETIADVAPESWGGQSVNVEGAVWEERDPGLAPDVVELARAGNKLGAIKRYRELTGADLREARDVIESL